MRNIRIYGLQTDISPLYNERQFFVNLGSGGFCYYTIEEFMAKAKNLLIAKEGPRGGHSFVPLLDNPDEITKRWADVHRFMDIAREMIDVKGKVINTKKGSYLIELDEYIPLKNGVIQYKMITSYKGYKIKFEKNGTCGFVIFKGSTPQEDRLWSIKQCKDAIEQMGGAK